MTTDCNNVLDVLVPHADEQTCILDGESLNGGKKSVNEVIGEKCVGGANFEAWCLEPVDVQNSTDNPNIPSMRVDIPIDKGIFG